VRSRPQSRRSPDGAPPGGLQCLNASSVCSARGGPNPPAGRSLGVA
jgi:hypothetical protein